MKRMEKPRHMRRRGGLFLSLRKRRFECECNKPVNRSMSRPAMGALAVVEDAVGPHAGTFRSDELAHVARLTAPTSMQPHEFLVSYPGRDATRHKMVSNKFVPDFDALVSFLKVFSDFMITDDMWMFVQDSHGHPYLFPVVPLSGFCTSRVAEILGNTRQIKVTLFRLRALSEFQM